MMGMRYLHGCGLLIAVAVVSACNNDSGRRHSEPRAETGVESFIGLSQVPSDGIVHAEGVTAQAQASDGRSGRGFAEQRDAVGSAISLRLQEGRVVGFTVDSEHGTRTMDVLNGDSVDIISGTTTFSSPDGDASAVLLADPGGAFEHQVFGSWQTDLIGGPATAGAGAFGQRTSSSSVPQSGTATYSGVTTGYASLDELEGPTVSTTQIQTDFNSGTITTSNTELVDVRTRTVQPVPDLDMRGTLDVVGNELSGSIGSSRLTGSVNGYFFGPNAEEVGGAFSATGDNAGYIGAFGASR